jgi:hypothetical protein
MVGELGRWEGEGRNWQAGLGVAPWKRDLAAVETAIDVKATNRIKIEVRLNRWPSVRDFDCKFGRGEWSDFLEFYDLPDALARSADPPSISDNTDHRSALSTAETATEIIHEKSHIRSIRNNPSTNRPFHV